MSKRQKHHYHFHADKKNKATDRTKHGPIRKRDDRPVRHYHQPGTGMGCYKSPFASIGKIGRFIRSIFGGNKGSVKPPSEESQKEVFVRPENAPKVKKGERAVTRVHQRKGEK